MIKKKSQKINTNHPKENANLLRSGALMSKLDGVYVPPPFETNGYKYFIVENRNLLDKETNQ